MENTVQLFYETLTEGVNQLISDANCEASQ